ncbi:hypothetical protein Dimus_024064, partial [Dionaea muscipula]
MELPPSKDFQEETLGRSLPPRVGISDGSLIQRGQIGEGSVLSFKEALQGVRRMNVDLKGPGCGETQPIVIKGESHGVDRLRRCCVIEWSTGYGSGLLVSDLLLDAGVDARVVMLSRLMWSLVFDRLEDFGKVLLLDRSWWASEGLSMTPWSDKPILTPKREVWLECVGVPLHLLVDGKSFDCWVVEELSATLQMVNGGSSTGGEPDSGQPREVHRSTGLPPLAATVNPLVLSKDQDLPEMSPSLDGDKTTSVFDSPLEMLLPMVACVIDAPVLPLQRDNVGIEIERKSG